MFPVKILYNKKFSAADIQIKILGASEWSSNAQYDERVMSVWQNKEQQAKEIGVNIWDGMYYRVTNTSDLGDADNVILKLGTIPYRYIATVMDLQEAYLENKLEPLFHLSTASIICTSNKQYVFGKRSLNGAIDLIGGGVQPDEIEIRSGIDLERNLLKEMKEEAGISSAHIDSIQGLGIIQSITSNVIIIFLTQLSLSESELIEVFKTRGENEMADLVFVTEKEIKSFLKGMVSYRPLIADLL